MKRFLLFFLTALGAFAGFESLSENMSDYKFSQIDYNSSFKSKEYPMEDPFYGANIAYGVIHTTSYDIFYFDLIHDFDEFEPSSFGEFTLSSLFKEYKDTKYTLDLHFTDGTFVGDCFIKTAKISPNTIRINYYPGNNNTKAGNLDSRSIINKLLNVDLEQITINSDNNSYSFYISDATSSYYIKQAYDQACKAPIKTAPSTPTYSNSISEKKPSEPATKGTASQPKSSTGGILSNFNKLAKKGSVPAIDLVLKKCGLYDSNISWEDAKTNLMNSNYNATIDEIGINFTCPFSYNEIVPTCMVLTNFKNTSFRFAVNDNDTQRNLARKLTEDMKAGGATIDYTIDTPEKAFRSYGNYRQKIISITTNKTGVLVDIF